MSFLFLKERIIKDPVFYILLTVAPAIFALKVALKTGHIVQTSEYFDITLQWPIKALLITGCVVLLWKFEGLSRPIAGLSIKISIRNRTLFCWD